MNLEPATTNTHIQCKYRGNRDAYAETLHHLLQRVLLMPNHVIQERPLSNEDLAPYRGQWVVLREGLVIASGSTPEEVRSAVEIESADLILLVPDSSSNSVFL